MSQYRIISFNISKYINIYIYFIIYILFEIGKNVLKAGVFFRNLKGLIGIE